MAKENLGLLSTRVNEYHRAFQKHEYKKVVEMWAPESRDPQDENDLRDWKEGQEFRVEKWCIKEASILDSIAKVSVWATGKVRNGPSSSERLEGVEDEYWKWEQGSWYFLPGSPPIWDDEKAKPVTMDSGKCNGNH